MMSEGRFTSIGHIMGCQSSVAFMCYGHVCARMTTLPTSNLEVSRPQRLRQQPDLI